MSPEHALLSSLLALHLGFVSRERLLEAAFAWIDDRETPLPARLGLAEPQRRAVDAAAAAFLEKSAGDAARALASAPLDAATQRALLGLRLPAPLPGILSAMRPRGGGGDERFRMGAEIGRGGLGRVVEAVDTALGREVAIKLVLPGMPAAVAERFEREARLTAKLDHPHVVPVHDFGELAGTKGRQLYLCMKRVRGRSLAEIVGALARGDAEAEGKWTRARLLAVFQDICLGAAYAHSKGIIHRDLKPSNVMIGDFGETLILDWGLARETGDPPEPEPGARTRLRAPKAGSSTLTMEGDVLGTPAYMPPEQAAGRLNEMDPRSDVFSLGAILFELLTFRPPYRAATPDGVLELARAGRVPAPSTVDRSDPGRPQLACTARNAAHAEPVPPELDAICLRACAFRREDRYPGALALHHDVQLFLEGVQEGVRRRAAAAARVAEAVALTARYRELRASAEAARLRLHELVTGIPRCAPLEERRRIWAAEEEQRALVQERMRAFASAEALFADALAADPGRADAQAGRTDLHLERYLEAEQNRDRDGMAVQLSLLAQLDPAGRHRAKLDAPGRLSVDAYDYGCDCLKPLGPRRLRVEFGEECVVAWRDGGPVPGAALEHRDCPVPALRLSPAGARVGHGPECSQRRRPGVRVFAALTVERERRLALEPERLLGETPLRDVPLPPGSYLCRLVPPSGSDLAETFLPVRIDRGAAWTQDVSLYRKRDIPKGFVQIPGGPFISGGGDAAYETTITRDVFFASFHVTCAEYLEFLNDLFISDPEAARSRVPRENDRRLWIEERKRFRLPAPGEDKAYAWRPDWPVFSVSWFDALAYAAWRSAREGRFYSLHHEDEYEKAARGVDGRLYPFGDHHEALWNHSAASLSGTRRPLPVGSFATDVSPYGVGDASGCAGSWCLNAGETGSREMRLVRGISWWSNDNGLGVTQRFGGSPGLLRTGYGLRLCWRPWAWPAEAAATAASRAEPATRPRRSSRGTRSPRRGASGRRGRRRAHP